MWTKPEERALELRASAGVVGGNRGLEGESQVPSWLGLHPDEFRDILDRTETRSSCQ